MIHLFTDRRKGVGIRQRIRQARMSLEIGREMDSQTELDNEPSYYEMRSEADILAAHYEQMHKDGFGRQP